MPIVINSITFGVYEQEFWAEIPGRIQWPWLDFGEPGRDKNLIGFDLVGEGETTVQVGYEQRDPTVLTAPFAVPMDTLTGQPVPLPVTGPTLSLRLNFERAPWKWQAATLYVTDHRRG